MARRSPTLEGFRLLFRMPSLGLAEIAWRWAVGAALIAAILFAIREYLDSLPVTRGDLLLLRTGHPFLVSRAIAHVFAGSAGRFLIALLMVGLTLAFAWIVISAVGRAVILKTVLKSFSPEREVTTSLGPLMELNALRAMAAFAGIAGLLGALILGALVSPNSDPSPGSAFLIFLAVGLFASLCFAMLNWFLSLAAIFVMAQNETAMGAVAAAVRLLADRTGAILAASTWFGLAHFVVYTVATSVIAFPLAMVGVLPAGVILGGVILTTLAYFAMVDYLYVGRLASYIFIAEAPTTLGEQVSPVPLPPASSGSIDASELILSDLPFGEAGA